MLSTDPVIGDSTIDPLAAVCPSIDPSIDPSTDPSIDPSINTAIDPAIDRSCTEPVSLSHFDCSVLVVSAQLAEIERLLLVHHMNSVPFPDDPLSSCDGDNKAYHSRVFSAPPRSRSA